MHRLPPVQCVERAKDCRNLAADKSLGLCAVATEPHSEVAECGVFDHEAVAHLSVDHFGEAVEYTKCSFLPPEELGEIGLAKPAGDAVADLYAYLRWNSGCGCWRGEVDLAETAFAY
jgi:hypothetical protein